MRFQMLIGIPPLLSPDALHALRSMGHGDEIALVDGNYPALDHARRLVRADGCSLNEVLAAVLTILPLDRAPPHAIYRTGQNNDPGQFAQIHHDLDATCAALAPGYQVKPLAGADFYPRVRAAFCVIATGERSLFANVILRKGVIHPDGRT
jgi:L-fucose mutarotase